jgi:hypothetical protein
MEDGLVIYITCRASYLAHVSSHCMTPLAEFQHTFDHFAKASLVAFSSPLAQCNTASPCNARPNENDSAGRRENGDDGDDELTRALTAARCSVAVDDDNPPKEPERRT